MPSELDPALPLGQQPVDDNAASIARSQARYSDPGPVASGQKAAEGRDWFDLKDAVEAPVRGVIGAAHGLYGLIDAVTGDALPDWQNPLGESTTVVGSALEDIFKFSAGFIPFAGVGGFAGLLPELAEGAGAIATIGRSALAAGLTGATVYEGHQKRVFDLLDNVPALKGPVTEFLKSNPDDPEIVGRFKNAVEQAGFAAAFEPLLMGLKGLWKAGRRLLENPKAPAAEIESVIQAETADMPGAIQSSSQAHPVDTVDGGTAIEPALTVGGQETLPPASEEIKAALESPPPASAEATAIAPSPEAAAAPAVPAAPVTPPAVEDAWTAWKNLENPSAPLEKAPMPDIGMPVPAGLEGTVKGLDVLGIPKADIKALIERMGEKEQLAPEIWTPEGTTHGPNPRAMSPLDQVQATVEGWQSNLKQFLNVDSVPVYLNAMEEAYLPAAQKEFGLTLDVVGLTKRTQAEFAELAHMVGGDEETTWARVMGNMALDRANLPRIAARTRAYVSLMNITAKTNIKHLEFVMDLAKRALVDDPKLNLELVRADYNARKFAALQFGVKGLKSDFGRALQSMGDAPYQGELSSYLEQAAKQGPTSGAPGAPDAIDSILTKDPQKLADTVNSLGGQKTLLKRIRKMQVAYEASGTEGLANMTRASVSSKVLNWTKEFWVNNLFGPKTVAINALSQNLNHVFLPYEGLFGAKLMRSIHGAPYDPVVSTFSNLANKMVTSPVRAFKMFSAMVKDGALTDTKVQSALFDTASGRADTITAVNAGFDPASLEGKALDTAGKLVRIPSKILGTTDSAVRVVASRSYAEAKLSQLAVERGIFDPTEQAKFVSDRVDKLIYNNQLQTVKSTTDRLIQEAVDGGLKDPAQIQLYVNTKLPDAFPEELHGLANDADAYAREGNFSNRSEPGTIAYSMQRLVAQHPWLGFVAPFISVPDKLLRWTGQRLDAQGFAQYALIKYRGWEAPALEEVKSRFLKDMLYGTPEAKARAVGRLATGATLTTAAGSLAASGVLIGGGPKDPEARAAWAADGRLPYSIKVGDGYLQFSRLDPVATTFAMAADVMDTLKHGHEEDTPAISQLPLGIAVAFSNLLQKSYLNGINGFLGALTDPQKNAVNYMRQFAGGFVPAGATLRAAEVPFGDPLVRDIRNQLDFIQARIPGISDKLPPQRNLLGEPIEKTVAWGTGATGGFNDFWLPIAYKNSSSDLVSHEIERLGFAFTPPKRTVNGLDLSTIPAGQTTAYDRLGELRGTLRLGGMTLKDNLERLIQSPQYQALTADPLPDGYLSPRSEQIQRVVRKYTSASWEQLKRENSALRQHDIEFTANKHRLRAGLPLSILPYYGGQ